MVNDLASTLAYVPIVDIALAAFFIWVANKIWAGYVEKPEYNTTEERSLGASVIMAQLSAIITGSSVILAGIGAFVALGLPSEIKFPENYHLFYGATWAVFALGLALLTMGALPTQTPKRNFVQLRGIAVLCMLGLFFSLAAGARFVLAVANILVF